MEFERLQDLITEVLGCEKDIVTPNASITEDLKADSLAVVELVMRLEDEVDLSIPDEDMVKLKTVQDILDYMAANL